MTSPSRACDFVLGNEGRATGGSTGNFIGLIDEVRISRVARADDQMFFATNARSRHIAESL